mmetsp:Transcript_18717/g.56633  ORF Transcript_18717/g.56633 Transcript_18717/m.56633 type:complete len:124 (+) Transcript_18717:183-554(+)
MAADPDAVAKAFTDHYYHTFDTNRHALGPLYQEQSLLTFEGQKTAGSALILQKLTSLPFSQCKHQISSLDAQPSMSNGINIVVTGQIITEGESQALKFSQFFHLAQAGASYVISNDCFRLNLA